MYCDIFQKESFYRKVWQSWQAATWRSTLDSSKNCPYKVLVELAMDSWRRVNRPDLVTRVQAADWDMMGLWIGSRDQSNDSCCSCWNLLGLYGLYVHFMSRCFGGLCALVFLVLGRHTCQITSVQSVHFLCPLLGLQPWSFFRTTKGPWPASRNWRWACSKLWQRDTSMDGRW